MELQEKFRSYFQRPAALLARAPGRVNLLGEHIDYNEGPVLPAAIDRAVHLAVAPLEEPVISLQAVDLGSATTFRIQDLEKRVDVSGNSLPDWAIYPAGVAWALQEAGLALPGIQAVYSSDIPIGSGLSSSAAVEVAFAIAWQSLAGWELDRMRLAKICQRAENAYLGVQSGLMDQFACLFGVAGHALYFDTRSLAWEALPLPTGTTLVIADSGVRRSLAASAYNNRRQACEQAVELLAQSLPNLTSLRDITPTEFVAYEDRLPDEVRKRAEHVVREIARVESAASALRRDDARTFGALMFAGHASLRDLYEVSLPELDLLVQIAHDLPGCLGARLTGAGFGGCTINLVEKEAVETFMQRLQAGYREKTGGQAEIFETHASAGASVES